MTEEEQDRLAFETYIIWSSDGNQLVIDFRMELDRYWHVWKAALDYARKVKSGGHDV